MFLFPFSYPWLFRRELQGSQSVLDVGCGKGVFVKVINHDRKYRITGVELFDPYIREAKKSGYFTNVIKHDIRSVAFPKDSFDMVISSQVIEHVTKPEAIKLIRSMKQWARRAVVIGVPTGTFCQDVYEGNELQRHKSTWEPVDFQALGFYVYGQGLHAVYGQGGFLEKEWLQLLVIRFISYVVSYIASPFVLFHPEYSTYLVAVWKKGDKAV